MTDERIHRAVSADGTQIAGRVWGRGPAVVLVHGGIGDGDVAWEAPLPYLTDQFTCYLPSTRGRGLSSDNPWTALASRPACWAGRVAAHGCSVRPSAPGPWLPWPPTSRLWFP